jgi:hypothetical protein
VSDVINLARAGLPSVGLITERFAEEADFVVMSAGMPDAPWLKLPYPIAGTGEKLMHQIALELAPQIISSLRAPGGPR